MRRTSTSNRHSFRHIPMPSQQAQRPHDPGTDRRRAPAAAVRPLTCAATRPHLKHQTAAATFRSRSKVCRRPTHKKPPGLLPAAGRPEDRGCRSFALHSQGKADLIVGLQFPRHRSMPATWETAMFIRFVALTIAMIFSCTLLTGVDAATRHCSVTQCRHECKSENPCTDFCGPPTCDRRSGTCLKRENAIRDCIKGCKTHPKCSNTRSR